MTTTPEKTKPAAPAAADLVTLTIDDREVSDPVLRHQQARLFEHGVGRDRHRRPSH